MKYPNYDWTAELSPSDAHLAAVWPLQRGERVTLHQNECPAYEGDGCRCQRIAVTGPTGLA